MPGNVVWTVLMSRHVDVAKIFYAEALGWTFEPFGDASDRCWAARGPHGDLVAVFVDVSGSDFPDAPELWLPCLAVADLDRRVEEAESLGATLLRPAMRIGNIDRVAILRQPGGGIVGWMAPRPD